MSSAVTTDMAAGASWITCAERDPVTTIVSWTRRGCSPGAGFLAAVESGCWAGAFAAHSDRAHPRTTILRTLDLAFPPGAAPAIGAAGPSVVRPRTYDGAGQ